MKLQRITIYFLLILISLSCKQDTEEEPIPYPPVRADFKYDFEDDNEDAPATIIFTNTSENGEEFTWDFGDRSDVRKTTNDTIQHFYEEAGNYEVTLTITGKGGNNQNPTSVIDRITKTISINETIHPLGLIPISEEELEQIPITSSFLAMGTLPAHYELDMPPIGNQGQQGSCVAWAVGYAMKSYQKKEYEQLPYTESNGSLDYSRVISPAYIYNQINGGVDRGSYFSDAFNLLRDQGACTLEEMPYNSRDYTSQPNTFQQNQASKHKIARWERIADNVADVKSFLYAGFPVIVSVPIYQSFDELNSRNSIWKSFRGTVRGYHAICVVGYDDSKNAFKIMNSWGTYWGDKGFCWIDYDFFPEAVRSAYIAYDVQQPNQSLSIKTQNTTNITASSAKLNLEISGTIKGTINDYGFCYALHDNPTRSDNPTSLDGTNQTGTYSKTITGLHSDTEYYVRAYMIYNSALIYGNSVPFTTDKNITLPIVETYFPSNIQETSAKFRGYLGNTGNGNVSKHGFYYSKTDNTPDENDIHVPLGSISYAKDFDETVYGLEAGTEYHVRAYARNEKGIDWGETKTFTTNKNITYPSVLTYSPTNIQETSAKFRGYLENTGNGNVSKHGFYYSKTDDTPDENDIHVPLGSISSTKDFNETVYGLEAGTEYHVRAYARNEKGIDWGETKTFTTNKNITYPSVLTYSPTNIQETSVKFRGYLEDTGNGNVSEHGFYYSKTDDTPDENDIHVPLGVIDGLSNSFDETVYGLEAGNEYHVRAYARNEKGIDWGETKTFETLKNSITVTINEEFGSVIIGNSARQQLTIKNDGNNDVDVYQITYPNGFSGDWSGGIIKAGRTKIVNVTFRPSSRKVYQGNIIYRAKSVLSDFGWYGEKGVLGMGQNQNQYKEYTVNGVSFKMVYVKGGSFTMGCNEERDGTDSQCTFNSPKTETVSDFQIAEIEVTQALYEAVMGTNPADNNSSDTPVCSECPVTILTHDDTQEFIDKLNEKVSGVTFRLPTIVEWEYAGRGGNKSEGYKYAGSNNIDEVAWHHSNSHAIGNYYNFVKRKLSNELGLYDMSGNVMESVYVGEHENGYSIYRLKGGAWSWDSHYARLALFISDFWDSRKSYKGFRLAADY